MIRGTSYGGGRRAAVVVDGVGEAAARRGVQVVEQAQGQPGAGSAPAAGRGRALVAVRACADQAAVAK